MIVMPADVTSPEVRSLLLGHPGRIGNLFSPGGWKTPLGHYGLDNGAFSAWRNGTRWKRLEWLGLCERAVEHVRDGGGAPAWLLVPDKVGDRQATIELWEAWAPRVREWYGWPLAFAVQDGMTARDVPSEAQVVFVGGSTGWKWSTYQAWCAAFPRVHVGRVNSPRDGWRCFLAGAESIDGTGWMRTDRQRAGLRRLLLALDTGEHPGDQRVLLWD